MLSSGGEANEGLRPAGLPHRRAPLLIVLLIPLLACLGTATAAQGYDCVDRRRRARWRPTDGGWSRQLRPPALPKEGMLPLPKEGMIPLRFVV